MENAFSSIIPPPCVTFSNFSTQGVSDKFSQISPLAVVSRTEAFLSLLESKEGGGVDPHPFRSRALLRTAVQQVMPLAGTPATTAPTSPRSRWSVSSRTLGTTPLSPGCLHPPLTISWWCNQKRQTPDRGSIRMGFRICIIVCSSIFFSHAKGCFAEGVKGSGKGEGRISHPS